MTNGNEMLDWLTAEKNAVLLKKAEVDTAKAAYLAAYTEAKTRLEAAEAKLETLIEAQNA